MRHDDAYLLDMLLAARDAVEFADGMTFQEFKQSRLHQNAILKSIEIVGEAAARISRETRGQHSKISWPEITGMRNRLVHAYFDVDLRRVWQVVRSDIPRLISLIEPLVPPEETQVT
jgi:uncharacterized protein with HEPN domain